MWKRRSSRRERDKLKAEANKIAAELNPTATTYPRGVVEKEKFEAERDKLKAEALKLRRDGVWVNLVFEPVKAAGAFALGAAAIWTVWNGYRAYTDEVTSRHRAEATHLVEALGSPQQPAVRMAAAIGLRGFPNDPEPKLREWAIDELAYGLGLETDRVVQRAMRDSLVRAMRDSLVKAGGDAKVPLDRMVKLVDREVQAALALGTEGCSGVTVQIKAWQDSVFAGVMALSQIGAPPPAQVPDFSGLAFKCYIFQGSDDPLRGARFRDSHLWEANFYLVDLTRSDFTGAQATGVIFNKTQLQGAVFTGSVLESADFTGRRGPIR